MKPCIICVAITGSLPRKSHNPAVPISITEQIESTHEAFEEGASILHAHVRNDDETPSSDPDKFAKLKEGVEKHCPGMIIQFSTGGRSGSGHERGGMLPLAPDMASLTVGSNNFPNRVYENDPALIAWLAAEMRQYQVIPEIEIFDLSHLFKAAEMAKNGEIPSKPYIQFVMGVKNAMPADIDVFRFYIETVKRLFGEDTHWCAAGIGANQVVINEWCAQNGGHMRTGLEDNIRMDRDNLAPSNAALVKKAADIAKKHGRIIASPAEARKILNIPTGK